MKKKLNNINILVIGDIMLDYYKYGEYLSIDRESPVPIFKEVYDDYLIGGSGNICNLLHNLGVNVVTLSSYNNEILNTLISNSCSDCLYDKSYSPTIRTKYIDERSNICVFSTIDCCTNNIKYNREILSTFLDKYKFDCVIIADYGWGVINSHILYSVFSGSINAPRSFILPYLEHINLYNSQYGYLMCTTEDEYNKIYKKSCCDTDNIYYRLKTIDRYGMELLSWCGSVINFLGTTQYKIFNNHSSKDMLISILAVCYVLDFSIEISMKIAEECVHYIIQQPTGSILPYKKFKSILRKYNNIVNNVVIDEGYYNNWR